MSLGLCSEHCIFVCTIIVSPAQSAWGTSTVGVISSHQHQHARMLTVMYRCPKRCPKQPLRPFSSLHLPLSFRILLGSPSPCCMWPRAGTCPHPLRAAFSSTATSLQGPAPLGWFTRLALPVSIIACMVHHEHTHCTVLISMQNARVMAIFSAD